MVERALFSHHELVGGVTLHHHRSTKWKTERLRLLLIGRPGTEAAPRALAAWLMRHGHRGMKGTDRVARFFQDAYGGGVTANVSRSARHHVFSLRGVVVDRTWLPRRPETLGALGSHLGGLLAQPWFAERGFPDRLFATERENLLRAIDGIADNKAHYAEQRLQELTFAGHPLATPPYGRREDVAALSRDDVVAAWRKLAEESPIHLFYVGSRSAREVVALLKRSLELTERPVRHGRAETPPAPRPRPRTTREKQPLSQARLAMSFRPTDHDLRGDLYPASFGNVIFGGGAMSRLFKIVREKHSLAYSIHSSWENGTGTLQVAAGTDGNSLDRVVQLVKAQVKEMARGAWRDEEAAVAFAEVEKSLEATRDSAEALIAFELGSLLGARRERDPEAVRKRYRRLQREEIADVFARMKLDTVFRLEPDAVPAGEPGEIDS